MFCFLVAILKLNYDSPQSQGQALNILENFAQNPRSYHYLCRQLLAPVFVIFLRYGKCSIEI